MDSVILTRKERIMGERAKMNKDRKRKVLGYALAGTVATSVMLHTNLGKAAACSDTYIVQKGDTLFSLAKKYNVSVKQIQEANGLSSNLIKIGQTLEVPSLEETHSEHLSNKKREINPVQKGLNHTKAETSSDYTVVPGDTLSRLAKQYNVSVEQIQKANELTSEMINVGQKLEIPLVEVHKAKKQATKNRSEKVTYAIYTVAPGESLGEIARQFNTSIDTIKAYNRMSTNAVLIGQKLIIKQKNFIKADATVVGAADHFSVEFLINGKPTVLQVAYGTASDYENMSGKNVEVVFYNGKRPTLVSYALVN